MHPLKHFRQAQGVEVKWLADKLQVNRATYSRWENGHTNPPVSLPYHLAHIFRLPVEDVLAFFSR